LLAVVFDQSALKYREFDGVSWGPVVDLDDDEGLSPQLLFSDNVPVIVYLSETASDQMLLRYTSRKTGSFSPPEPLDAAAKQFDSAILYDASSCSYAVLTDAAGGSATADVYHPLSGTLIKQDSDAVFLGMDQKFRYVKLLLSTAGSGGTVSYSYWDGSNWRAFTPVSGDFNLDATDYDLLLWQDYFSMPGDWQKKAINDDTRFWVMIRAVSPFATGPVGSQITAISDLRAVSVRR